MKFAGFIFRSATRNRLRTVLTAGGVGLLVFVLIFMMTALSEMEAWQGQSATHLRVAVQHTSGLANPVPYRLQAFLEGDQVSPHARHITKMNWFGGIYQKPENWFANFAIDHDRILDLWDEFSILEDQFRRLGAQRDAAIVGESLANKFGWKIGERITLLGTIYPVSPELEIVGIFKGPRSQDEEQLFFRWDYFDELLGGRKIVGTYWMKARTESDIPKLKEIIDGHTKNSEDPTETLTEKEFGAQFMAMMGNIKGLIFNLGVIVLLIMTLMTANTIAMSARERVVEVAVLRTLGFRAGQIFVFFIAESVLLAMIGSGIAVGGSWALFNLAKQSPAPQFFPYFTVTPTTMTVALGAGLACGIVAAAVPAWRAAGRRIVDGLRQVV